MAWILLTLAGVLEVVWASLMKQSDGFTRPYVTTATVLTMAASVSLLSVAMKTLPLGTAYTVWTGIGAVGAFLVGTLAFGETVGPMRAAAVALIVAGIVMLKLSTPLQDAPDPASARSAAEQDQAD
ncbi:DMT family transporter [Alienimonas californiensis]|uniref:Guanidinium exporter n=1 Tax=Alienimonas californiensis TaxID=2527989 RepID=A0A517PCA3_9PLAN|nr:multidrug efflux SMR transporter [Alienimonas californiensis]QDT17017.1 Quaternary ammonium compound-resistance protein SugE [Alienimonas californiensis]